MHKQIIWSHGNVFIFSHISEFTKENILNSSLSVLESLIMWSCLCHLTPIKDNACPAGMQKDQKLHKDNVAIMGVVRKITTQPWLSWSKAPCCLSCPLRPFGLLSNLEFISPSIAVSYFGDIIYFISCATLCLGIKIPRALCRNKWVYVKHYHIKKKKKEERSEILTRFGITWCNDAILMIFFTFVVKSYG